MKKFINSSQLVNVSQSLLIPTYSNVEPNKPDLVFIFPIFEIFFLTLEKKVLLKENYIAWGQFGIEP